ncbi:MAG TPA: hypothetical protein VGC89_04785, partial [Pyrinomonadaceae bacterium]
MFPQIKTRVLTAFIAVALVIAGLAPGVEAQRRKRRASINALVVKTHPEPHGTRHPRPPRDYDVLNYTIRTRFDVANKTVIGDETVTLKPLAADFRTL